MRADWHNKATWLRARRELEERGHLESRAFVQAVLNAACANDSLRQQILSAMQGEFEAERESLLQRRERVLWGRFMRLLSQCLQLVAHPRWSQVQGPARELARELAMVQPPASESDYPGFVSQLENIERLCAPLRRPLEKQQVEETFLLLPAALPQLRSRGIMTALAVLDRCAATA